MFSRIQSSCTAVIVESQEAQLFGFNVTSHMDCWLFAWLVGSNALTILIIREPKENCVLENLQFFKGNERLILNSLNAIGPTQWQCKPAPGPRPQSVLELIEAFFVVLCFACPAQAQGNVKHMIVGQLNTLISSLVEKGSVPLCVWVHHRIHQAQATSIKCRPNRIQFVRPQQWNNLAWSETTLCE